MVANYIRHNPESGILSGKALTLGGSVVCDGKDYEKKYYSGDLSAILLSNSPKIAELHRTPSRKIALMADFTKKTAEICKICSKVNVTNFSGVPSWNLMLMNKILDYTGKKSLLDVWPNLELFMHGGIGFTPYKSIFNELIPTQRMNYLENYNASEGYFAFQDDLNVDGMLLCTANGVYYEFIPMDKFNKVMRGESDDVISLDEVKIGVNYAIVVSTVSGLWRYLIGDCVKFVSIYPHRVKVSGRTQLYINAFGEELMIDNAEKAIYTTCNELGCRVKEFTVSPHFMALNENNQAVKGYHKWAIEFSKPPIDMDLFEKKLDYNLTQVNSDYEAKRKNNSTMERLRVFPLKEGTFYLWMEKREKVGGQNKVPRLYPDTHFFDELIKINNSIK